MRNGKQVTCLRDGPKVIRTVENVYTECSFYACVCERNLQKDPASAHDYRVSWGGDILTARQPASESLPLGVILRRSPGVTRWAAWAWRATGVIPGAAPAIWKMLRRDGDVTEFHIGTLPLTLWSAETEAYVAGLAESPPAVYDILRPKPGDRPFDLLTVTASPFEAQDYADNGEDVV